MKYKRDADAVRKRLKVTDNDALITTEECSVHMPVRFTDRGLGDIGIENRCYGLFPLIMSDGTYMVFNFNSICDLNPYKFSKITIDEEEYYVFTFAKDSVVIKNLNVVKVDTLIYNVFDEFIFKGKLPWYADYEKDVCRLFTTALTHAGNKIVSSKQLFEMLGASVCRSKSDMNKQIRNCNITGDVEFQSVGINNIYHSVRSPINKITGSYMREGIISALNTNNDSVSKVEKILRA